MEALVQEFYRLICYIMTFLALLFPSAVDHSCDYCKECNHVGGAASCIQQAVCDLCGEYYGEYGEHKYLPDEKVEPDCENTGYTVYTCYICEMSYNGAETDALGHLWNQWTVSKEATCTSGGEMIRTCQRDGCNASEKKTTPRLEHSFTSGEYKWNSTDKTHSEKCTGCSTYGSATECSFDKVVTEPTYSSGGYTTYICNVCGNSYVSDYTSPLM